MRALFLFLLLVPGFAFAKIWRVDNTGSGLANFTQLQAANDSPSVVAGDTLYLYPSVSQYDPATINKRLIILGIGYDLSNTLAVEVRPVRVNVISFRYGASGAQISGLVISQISIETSGVNVIANKIEGGIAGSSSTGIQATLQRNWIMGYYYFGNKYSIQNIVGLISNNIIGCHVYIPSSSPGTMSIVAHNVIGYRASAAGCSSGSGFGAYTMVYNNAFYKLSNGSNGLSGASDTQIQYNLFEQASLSGIGSFNQISNNQYGLNFASGIFQLPSSGGPSLDSHFKLAAGSVGLGTGSAGADIGAYGGNTPYKESGLIAIPYVYSIIAPPTGGATVPFSVEIKLISPRTSF